MTPYEILMQQAYRDFEALKNHWATMPQSFMQNTWGAAVKLAAGGAIEFTTTNGIIQEHVNAVAHAYVSADIVYFAGKSGAIGGAVSLATALGDLKEFVPHIFSDSNPKDTLKDQWNNEIGRQIGLYAVENDLTHEQMLALMLKAYRDGVIAKDEEDPRLGGNPNWRVTDEFAQKAAPHCFTAGTLIDMWPVDTGIKPGANGFYDRTEVLAKVWRKPIEEISRDDWVVSFDDHGNLKPGKVKRTFINRAKIILNFFGTRVTPGHAFYRADSKKAYKFEPLIDILRDDGVIQREDGTLIRAATGCEFGSADDQELWAFLFNDDDSVRDKKKLRLGTRWMLPGGRHFSMREYMDDIGLELQPDGHVTLKGSDLITPFIWVFSDTLPNPEDFILQRSGTTLEDIYKAAEWEGIRPDMPPPMVRDGGPVQPLSRTGVSLMPRNTPLAMRNGGYASGPVLNRKQRKAAEARERQQAKAKKQLVH